MAGETGDAGHEDAQPPSQTSVPKGNRINGQGGSAARERLRSTISFGLLSRNKLAADVKDDSQSEEGNNRNGSGRSIHNSSPRSTQKLSPAARVFASAANSIRIGKSFVAQSSSPRDPHPRLGMLNTGTLHHVLT